MKTSVIKHVDARMVSVALDDVGDYVMPVWRFYGMHSTGNLKPERVEMRWENGDLIRLSVYGKRMKNDGTVGNADSSTQFVVEGRLLEQNPRPDWLIDLLVEWRP